MYGVGGGVGRLGLGLRKPRLYFIDTLDFFALAVQRTRIDCPLDKHAPLYVRVSVTIATNTVV